MLGFMTQGFPLEAWLQSRFNELYLMKRTAILAVPLTTQVNEISRFQNQVELYKPRLSELESVASSLPDQSDSSPAQEKVAYILKEYGVLVSLAGRRVGLLASFLPRIKLYEGSLESWEYRLSGWEESSSGLTPPTMVVALLRSQIEVIKVRN